MKSFTPLEAFGIKISKKFLCWRVKFDYMSHLCSDHKKYSSDGNRLLTGFTLIEILISITLFIFILFSFQAFLSSIFSSEFRAVAMKNIADDARSGLEIMGREMRLAQVAANSSCITHNENPNNKSFMINSDSGGDMFTTQGSSIEFIDFDGNCVQYAFNPMSGVILKRPTKPGASQIFLGGDSKISVATFNLIIGPGIQPRVAIHVKVSANDPTSPGRMLEIPLQTTVSQREINIE